MLTKKTWKMALKNVWILLSILVVFVDAVERKDTPEHHQRVNDQAEVLAGISRIASRQKSGFICIFQERSFPILHAVTEGTLMPTAAGGRYGKGRVVSFAHDAALEDEPESNKISDRKQLFDNIFKWVSAGKQDSVLFLWGCHRRPETQNHIGARFKTSANEAINTKHTTINSKLSDYNVVVLLGEFSGDVEKQLQDYIENGGGLVMAATNWYYGIRLKGLMREWPPRKVQALADHAWRANPWYHQQGWGGPFFSISALGQLTGGCEEGTERPITDRKEGK